MYDVGNDSPENIAKRNAIFTRITSALPGAPSIQPGKALFLTPDAKVVEEGDPDAAFVLCGPLGSLPADLAKELGIKAGDVKPKPKPDQTKSGVTFTSEVPPDQNVVLGGDAPK